MLQRARLWRRVGRMGTEALVSRQRTEFDAVSIEWVNSAMTGQPRPLLAFRKRTVASLGLHVISWRLHVRP